MAEKTPMMRQYWQLKEQHKDCILLFRLGDFYEMFFEDAQLAARELELTLTTRDRNAPDEEKTPMCGVPHHSAEMYIARLITAGYKVAVCEQMEDPALAKGLVKREVVRIITPGTVLESSMLDESRHNFCAAISLGERAAGICFADVSTGTLHVAQHEGGEVTQKLLGDLGRFVPREAVLCARSQANASLCSFLRERLQCALEAGEELPAETALSMVLTQFKAENAAALGIEGKSHAILAVASLLAYLGKTHKGHAVALHEVNLYDGEQFMELDLNARRHLELSASLRTGGKEGSLLGVLDLTGTPMGARQLRADLERPLRNPVEIGRRLAAVEELFRENMLRSELRALLAGLSDMERLISRVVYGSASGRDVRALSAAAARMPQIIELMMQCGCALMTELRHGCDDLCDLRAEMDNALVDSPPLSLREGGVIRDGYHAEVDRLRNLRQNTLSLVAQTEASEREKTGIKSLKIGYNRVFGYYIEVTKSYYGLIPSHYIRKQTLASCERFITEELKVMESELLTAQERLYALEYELFMKLLETLAAQAHRFQRTAQAMARLDVALALAEAAARYHYVRPTVDFSGVVDIRDGRHPVVERVLDSGPFVPNDTALAPGEPVAIITGPNMAGKSTYMRQVALIAVMAHMGSFVPARSARMGVMDRVFTRIGASDDLAGGRSTFMVEMTEVADILQNATAKSLLILDEIGRGTSTYDGMAVARAVLEFVTQSLKAKTLFATHYHELTELEAQMAGVKNYNVAVKKKGSDILFLRKIVPGGADDSYGVEVAGLAGLPPPVVRRAKDLLTALEAGGLPSAPAAGETRAEQGQMSMLDLQSRELSDRLLKIDCNTLSPLEALQLLYELQKMVRS